jgi:hypothetical protein
MTIRSIKQHKQWLVPVALVVALAGVFVARTAFAKIVQNTIDPVATLSEQGRHLTLTGPLAVTAGERVALRVTVTQRTTGALAEGDTHPGRHRHYQPVDSARPHGGPADLCPRPGHRHRRGADCRQRRRGHQRPPVAG